MGKSGKGKRGKRKENREETVSPESWTKILHFSYPPFPRLSPLFSLNYLTFTLKSTIIYIYGGAYYVRNKKRNNHERKGGFSSGH